MDNLDEDRMVELLSRKVLTEAEEDELWELSKPKLEESVLSQKETDELLAYMKQGSQQPRKVLSKTEEKELWELSKPKKTQPLSEAEVNEFLSTVQPDFQSLAKMRQAQKLRHLNIATKATDLVKDGNTQDSGREM